MNAVLSLSVLLFAWLLGACQEPPDPSAATSTRVVALTQESCGVDAPKDGDGCYAFTLTATKTYGPSTWYGDARCLCRPMRVAWPAHLDVAVGNAGNHWTDLIFVDAETERTEYCRYKGGASQAHPSDPVQIALGLRYNFHFCSNGQTAGDQADVRYLRLHLANGDSYLPSTAVMLTLSEVDAACASDEAAPSLLISAPTAGVVHHSPAWVEGDVSDEGPVRISAAGFEGRVHSGRFLVGPIPLSEGSNTVEVIAEDARGHLSSASRTLDFVLGGVPVPPDEPGVNQAPLFTSVALERSAAVGTTYEYQAQHADPDGDLGVAYSLAGPSDVPLPDPLAVNTGPVPASCVKIEGAELGVVGLQRTLDGARITITGWTPKADEPDEYVGFQYTSELTHGFLSVKAGTSLYPAELTGAWTHPNGTSGSLVKATSNIVFCGTARPPVPVGAAIDGATGLFNFTPSSDQVGLHDFTLRVSDPGGLYAEQSFRLRVYRPNQPPVFTSAEPPSAATVGVSYTHDFAGSDPDPGTSLVYSLAQGPEGMRVDAVSGLLVWTPGSDQVGTHQVTVLLSDQAGACTPVSFFILVGVSNTAPVITSTPITLATQGDLYTYQVVADDPDPSDTLSFSLDLAPEDMVIDNLGLISWYPTNADVGAQPVIVRVSDSAGLFAVQAFSVEVADVNDPPQFTSVPVTGATIGEAYEYEVVAVDPDAGDVVAFSVEQGPPGMAISLDGLLSWVPQTGQVGEHPVTLRATDLAGAYAEQSFVITVVASNVAPLIVSEPLLSTLEDELYAYQVLATDTPDDLLSYSLEVAPAGMSIDLLGLITWIPDNAAVGEHPVRVRVTDQGGAFDVQSYVLTVLNVNDPPRFTSVPVTGAMQDAAYAYQLAAEDDDVDDVLSFVLVAGPAGMALSPSGLLTWTPSNDDVGEAMVTVQVVDLAGASDSQTFTITVENVNDAPVITSSPVLAAAVGAEYVYTVSANDPDPSDVLSYSLQSAPSGMSIQSGSGRISWTPGYEDLGPNPVTVRVTDLAGASDAQSFVVEVTGANRPPVITSTAPASGTQGVYFSYQVTATDPDPQDTLSFALDLAPAGMSIDPGSGLIEWIPTNAQVGENAVTVRVTDGGGLVAYQSFVVLVANVNDPPEINSSPPSTAREGSLFVYLVSATDPDPADVLTFSLAVAPAGATIGALTGLLEWTPSQEQVGSQAFSVRVTDPAGATATQSFHVEVENVNDRPEITSEPVTSAVQGEEYRYDVIASDPDPEDELEFSLELAPAGMTISPHTGAIDWTPSQSQVGRFEVRVRVADLEGASDTQSFSVDVTDVNDAPQFTSTPPAGAVEGQLYVYQARASDPDRDDVLSFGVVTGPTGLLMDAATGLVTFTPGGAQVGAHAVVLRVTDAGGLEATQSYSLVVANVNDPPVFMSQPPVTAVQHQLYVYEPEVLDPDLGEVLSFELDLAPPGMTVDPVLGRVNWQPGARQVGDYGVTLLVWDQAGAMDLQSFTITVMDVNDAPSFISAPVTSAQENTRYEYRARAVDPDVGDVLSYSLPLAPAGMRVDAASGHVTWVPGTSQVGSHTVLLRAIDRVGAHADQSFVVVVGAESAPCVSGTSSARCSAMGWAHVLGSDGRPLSGVVIEEQGPGGTRVFSSDPVSGLAALGGGPPGTYHFQINVPLHTPTFSEAQLSAQTVSWVPTSRHAPLVDSAGPIFSEGASFEDVDGRLELSFPPNATAGPALLAAAVLDGPTLPKALPLGYSPALALWYEVDGLLQETPIARFRLPAPLPPSATLVLASFDRAQGGWVAESLATAPSEPTPFPELIVPLGLPGGYALLLPDPGAPAVTLGQVLPPAALSAPDPTALLAAGQVSPEVQVASDRVEDVTGEAEVRLARADSSLSPLPSGMVLPARLYERYVYPDGTETELSFVDLAVAFHRYPPVRPKLGSAAFDGLVARFPVRPRFLLTGDGFADVHQRIDVLSELSFVGAAMDASGGVIATAGVQVSLPANALLEPTLITLTALPGDSMTLDGQRAAIGFSLDWSGPVLPSGSAAALDVTGLRPNQHYVLAQRVVSEVQSGSIPVERFLTDSAGQLTSLEPAGVDRLPGLVRGGSYGLFERPGPEGLVRGVVERSSGAPVEGAVVRVQDGPWRFVTASTGRFLLVASPGEVLVAAEHALAGESGEGTGSLASATGTLDVVVVIGERAPRISRTEPASGAALVSVLSPVDVYFSEPLDPASVGTAGLEVSVAGESVAGVVSLRSASGQAARMLRFLPSRPLPYASQIDVQVAASVTDRDGLALEGPTGFSFTTEPARARYAGGPRLTSYAPGSLNTPCAPYDPAAVGADFDPTGLSVGVPGFDPSDPTITCVVGSRGVSDPNVPVVLVNEDRGSTSTVLSLGNGSFKGFVRGAEEELLSAVFVNQNGTRLVVPLDMQKFDDGTVALYVSGGVVTAENPFGDGPLELVIEPGAIARRAKIKLEARSREASLDAANGVAPLDGTIAFGFAVDYDGPPLSKPADIRFPVNESSLNLPSGTRPAEVQFMLMQPRTLTVEGESVLVYDTVDKVEYEGGALATHSFPFLGLLFSLAAAEFQRLYTINWTSTFPTPVHGVVVGCEPAYDGTNTIVGCAGALETAQSQLYDVIPEGRRIPGAVVFAELQGQAASASPGRLLDGQSVSVSAFDGRYTLGLPNLATSSYSIRALHPEFPGQAPATGVGLEYSPLADRPRSYANVIFATQTPFALAAQGPSLSVSHTPQRPPVFSNVEPGAEPGPGEWAELRVVAQHPTEVPTGLRVSVSSVSPLITGETVSPDDILGTAQPVESTSPPGENKRVAVYRISSRKAAQVRLSVEGTTQEGASRIVYALYFGGTPPPPSPELPPPDPNDQVGPYVVRSWPEEGSLGFAPGGPLVLTFSEPVSPSVLTSAAGIELSPAAGAPVKRLDATRTRLELIYPGLERDWEYALAVTSEVQDLSGNALDQDPLAAGNQSFVLRFRTAVQRGTELGAAFPELDFGGGAEVHGIHAFVLDRSNSVLRIYDLSNPLAPQQVNAVDLPGGYPRDLEVISRFSYVRPQGARNQPPCGVLHSGEVPWVQGFTSTTSVNLGCASLERTLVAVVGGLLRPTLTEGVASGASQYLRVLDVTDVRNVFLVNTANITLDPTALVGQLKWSPPSLSYVERSGTIDTVNAVHLQVFLFGSDLDAEQYSTMPLSFLGTPGLDLNGDGDFTDPNEILPMPSRPLGGIVDLGFAGKRLSVYPEGTTQGIFSYAYSGRRGFVGAALGTGRALSSAGEPLDVVPPSYRTLASGGTFLAGPVRDLTTVRYGGREVRSVGYFPDLALRIRAGAEEQQEASRGVVEIVDLAVVGVYDRSASESRLHLYDLTDPLQPRVLGDPAGLLLPGEQGYVSAVDQDPVDPSVLRVRTSEGVIRLSVELLTMSNVPGGGHPAILGVVAGVGTTLSSAGASDYGVYARSAEKQVVFTGPELSFVSFPNASVPSGPGSSGLVFPDDVRAALMSGGDVAKAERMLARLRSHDALRLSAAKTQGLVTSDLDPPRPESHYFVLMRAPGSSGSEVPLLLEATNDSGTLVPHAGAGLAPTLAASPGTVSSLGRSGLSHAAPVPRLMAQRLSDDRSSPHYNLYLGGPFVLTHQALTSAERAALETVSAKPRLVLFSAAGLRASVDPSLSASDNPLFAFKSRLVAGESRPRPGSAAYARTFDVHRALGPNPSPVVGSVRARGTSGLVAAHNGELSIERTDLELPTRRGTLRFIRSYRGQDRVPGPFGLGWSHGYNERISELSPELAPPSGLPSRKLMLVHRGTSDTVLGEHDVIHHDGLGNAVHYKAHPEGELPESYSTDPIISAWAASLLRVYTPEPGVYDALVKMKSGHFVRVTPDGMQHWFGPTGRLEKIYDRFEANWQHLVYTSLGELRAIVDRSVEVPRRYELGYYRGPSDPVFTPGLDEHTSSLHKAGLVRRLKDSAGREVLYSYDAHNRLVQVEEAMGGGQTRRLEYGYGNDDRLHTVEDGSVTGRPLLTAEGAMQSDGRITRVDGPRGRVLFTYAHENLARAMGVGSETHLLLEDGASERLRLNPRGLVERKTSSGPVSGVEVREFGYHDDVVLRSVRAPRGNIETLEYERDLGDDGLKALRSQGNVRSITRSPGGSGSGGAQTALRRFDARYNLASGAQTDTFGRTEFVSLSPNGKSVLAVTKGGESTTFVTDPETGQLRAEVSTTGVDAAYEYHPTRAHVVEATIGGVTTRYGYETCGAISDLGLPCTVTPAASLPVEYTYTRGGFLETLRKGGYELSYRYSPFGDLERAEESVEPGRYRIQTWAHDDLGQVLAETSEAVETFTAPAGEPLTTTYRRDLLGRVEEVIAADGTETRLSYDHQDRVHTVTTGAYSEAYFYDTNGNLERQEVGDAITRWSYDGLDRLTGVADAEGGHLSLSYRPNGDLWRGAVTQLDAPEFGLLREVSQFERDAFGRSRGFELGGRSEVAYHLSPQGRRVDVSGPLGRSEVHTWDSGTRPKLSSRSGVHSVDRGYDAEGRLASLSIVANGQDYGGSLGYDSLSHLERVEDASGTARARLVPRLDGAVTQVVFDPEDLALETTVTQSILGEPLSVSEGDGTSTAISLDRQRRLASWGPSGGGGREYRYDDAHRLVSVVHADGSATSFSSFDARNRPQAITLPGGSMTAGYDKLGRRTSLSSTFGGVPSSETVRYDALDQVRSMTFDGGALQMEYDSLGALLRTELSTSGRTFDWSFSPDASALPQLVTYPSRVRVSLGRDVGQRLRSMTDVSGSVTGEVIASEAAYATPDRLGSVRLGGSGLLREDVYDARQRLQRRIYRTAGPGAQVVADLRYAYDGADREVARQYGHRGHRTDLYVYGEGGRLIRADLATRLIHPDNAPLTAPVHGWDVTPSQGPETSGASFLYGDVVREYGFDSAGKDHLESVLSTTYDGPGAGPTVAQVVSSLGGEDAVGFLTEVDGFMRMRDALGNATRIETRAPEAFGLKAPLDLVFDAHSRLRRATRQDGVRVDYEYRADGVLLSRKVICGTTPPPGCTDRHRLYLYDGMLLLEEVELGASPSQDRVMARYYYAEEGDIPVAGDFRVAPGPAGMVRLYYVVDRQGSTLGLVDEAGAWVERVKYDVWGTPLFEQADVMPPVVSEVRTDVVTGDVVVVMSEPVVPRAVLPGSVMEIVREAVDLSSEVYFEDGSGQVVPGRVVLDLDAADAPGVPVGSVLRWVPDAPVSLGTQLVLRIGPGAVVDDWSLGTADTSLAVTYGTGVSYTGPPAGSTRAVVQAESVVGNRLLWQSHFWDADVGLYHMRARMYDVRTGMFLSRDPSGFRDSPDLYAGFGWDPIGNRDPTGRDALAVARANQAKIRALQDELRSAQAAVPALIRMYEQVESMRPLKASEHFTLEALRALEGGVLAREIAALQTLHNYWEPTVQGESLRQLKQRTEHALQGIVKFQLLMFPPTTLGTVVDEAAGALGVEDPVVRIALGFLAGSAASAGVRAVRLGAVGGAASGTRAGPGALSLADEVAGRLSVVDDAAGGLSGAIGGRSPAMDAMLAAMSRANLRHSVKHLADFQQLDPGITATSLRELGARIATNEQNLISGAGAAQTVFERLVRIGQANVTVRVVLNRLGNLHSIHIRN